MAKESASKFNPLVKLEAHHANIKDPQFNLDFFQSFTLVFNALDNLDARRYVNRMCLAAGVPLIESGTTGFNGQVQIIQKVGFENMTYHNEAYYHREKRNAMIVPLKRHQRPFLFVPSEAHQAYPYIVSYGQKAIFSLKYLGQVRTRRQNLIIRRILRTLKKLRSFVKNQMP